MAFCGISFVFDLYHFSVVRRFMFIPFLEEIPSFTISIPFAPALVNAGASVIGFALVRTFVRFLRG
jgi:hypothetical protein